MTASLRQDPDTPWVVWIEEGRFSLHLVAETRPDGHADLAITAYPNGIIFQEPPIESPGAWPRDSFAVEELGAKLPQAIRLLEPNATAAMQALGFTSHEMLPLMTRIRHTLATTRQETPR